MKNSKFLVLVLVASMFCLFGCNNGNTDSVITVEVTNWEKSNSTLYGYTEGVSWISGATFEGTGYQVSLNINDGSYKFSNMLEIKDGERQGNMLGYQSNEDIIIKETPADGKFTFETEEFAGYVSDGNGKIDSGKTFKIVSNNATYKE